MAVSTLLMEIGGKVLAGAAGGAVTAGLFLWREWQQRTALRDGEFTEEVLVAVNIVEDVGGKPFLKPRTIAHEKSVSEYFSNKDLARRVMRATKRCTDGLVESQFILLDGVTAQNKLMKRVVNIASSFGTVGHLRRMFGVSHTKHDGYVCMTYSQCGDGDRIIRIDLVSAIDMRRFLDPTFVANLGYRPEEGSHADNAEIFHHCAKLLFGDKEKDPMLGLVNPRDYVRRVSIPTAS